MCDVSDSRLLNAYQDITEYENTDWLIAGYKGSKNVIGLLTTGEEGLSEFKQNLTNEVLFGFIRIEDKFVFITYVPNSVNGVKRARALVHSRSVASVCSLAHTQMTVSSLSELSESAVRARLKLSEKASSPKNAATKRTSITPSRRRSAAYTPDMNLQSSEEPETDDVPPTSPTFSDSTTVVDSAEENKEDPSESLFQTQLRKKREMDEARFKQSHTMPLEPPSLKHQPTPKSKSLTESLCQPMKEPVPNILIPESPTHKKDTTTHPSIDFVQSPSTIPQTHHPLHRQPIIMDGLLSVQVYPIPYWKRRYFAIQKNTLLIYNDETFLKAPVATIALSHDTKLEPPNEGQDMVVPGSFMIHTQTQTFHLLPDDKSIGKKIFETIQSQL
ncbi:hypothetical protein BY458DRAFT_528775 [Sporodiniella umbellata]|nr:hypothetical protein BY458DRAFT_528775 [Sporodiniella umbellata]